jgi:hypothetical protein
MYIMKSERKKKKSLKSNDTKRGAEKTNTEVQTRWIPAS